MEVSPTFFFDAKKQVYEICVRKNLLHFSKIPSTSIDRRFINVLNAAGIVHANRDERVSQYICIKPQLARLVLRCSVVFETDLLFRLIVGELKS